MGKDTKNNLLANLREDLSDVNRKKRLLEQAIEIIEDYEENNT